MANTFQSEHCVTVTKYFVAVLSGDINFQWRACIGIPLELKQDIILVILISGTTA